MNRRYFPPAVLNQSIFIFLFPLLAAGCGTSASTLFPPTKESRQKIAEISPQLDSLDEAVALRTKTVPIKNNFSVYLSIDGIDGLLDCFAQAQTNDIQLTFLPTPALWKEEKKILGMGYTNQININSGMFFIDIKKFRFKWGMNNTLNAEIEIEGKGNISVSGTYSGISASASPQLFCYLNENILFTIAADSESLVLTPQPKTLLLKAKATVNLLKWEIPFYKEIPLQAAEIIKPIRIPVSLSSQVAFPLPAKEYGSEKVEFVTRELRLSGVGASAKNNILELHGNIQLIKP